MSVIRPLSLELLKKMFLKVLHNTNFGAEQKEQDFITIISSSITDYFEIPALLDEEFDVCLKAVYELHKSDLIQLKDDSDIYYELTDEGKKYVEEKLACMQLPSKEIYQYVTRLDLREEVLNAYLDGDYEDSIYKAFKLLEERVKENTIIKPSSLNNEEVSNYYISKDGNLKFSNFQHDEELASLRRIMKGTMLWFKDPISNNTMGFNNAEAAAQILVFANMHLNLIDQ